MKEKTIWRAPADRLRSSRYLPSEEAALAPPSCPLYSIPVPADSLCGCRPSTGVSVFVLAAELSRTAQWRRPLLMLSATLIR